MDTEVSEVLGLLLEKGNPEVRRLAIEAINSRKHQAIVEALYEGIRGRACCWEHEESRKICQLYLRLI